MHVQINLNQDAQEKSSVLVCKTQQFYDLRRKCSDFEIHISLQSDFYQDNAHFPNYPEIMQYIALCHMIKMI